MPNSPKDILAVRLNPEGARDLLAMIGVPDEALEAELEILNELDFEEYGNDDFDC